MRRLALTFILALLFLFILFYLLIFGRAGSSLLLWFSLVVESGGCSRVVVLGHRRQGLDPWSGKSPEGGNGNPLTVFLPGVSHGQRSLEGYNPWSRKESDMTERLSTHSLIDSPKSVNNFLLPPQQMTMSLVVLNNTNVSYLRFWKSDIQNQCH